MFDVNYFIDKFENIPDKDWCRFKLENELGQRCALGHCGVDYLSEDKLKWTEEGEALESIFRGYPFGVAGVNDYEDRFPTSGHPKENILYVLRRIRDNKPIKSRW